MSNHYEEFFIEAVSNASMEVFPENTLTKFSNKLARPIDLNGDWVVGIQEIFYPTDISASSKNVSLQLLIGRSRQTQDSEFTLEQNEPIESVLTKINTAIAKAWQNNMSKRVKRDAYAAFQSLLTSSSSNLSTNEKIKQLEDIKSQGISVFNRLWDRINNLSQEITTRDTEISKLSSTLTAKDQLLQRTTNELKSSKDYSTDLEKFKKVAKAQIDQQLEKITKLEKEPGNQSEIVHLRENLAAEKSKSLRFEKSVVAKMGEIAKLQEDYQKLKLESDNKLNALNEQHAKLEAEGATKIKELQLKLDEAKSPEAVKKQKLELDSMKEMQEKESKKIKKEIETEKKKLKEEQKLMKNREVVYQQQLETLNAQSKELKGTIAQLNSKLEKYVPIEEVEKLKEKLTDLDVKKAAIEAANNELKAKETTLSADVDKLNKAIKDSLIEKERLVGEVESIKKELHKLQIPDDFVPEINENDAMPSIDMYFGRLRINRGYLDNQTVIPIFSDPAFVQALGFDSYGYLDELKRLMTTEKFIKAVKEPTLDFKPHLMFVYSDIVSEHFVGDKCARVLRVLPLKRSDKHEIVHERFLKPFYYPLRSNRIENINFILTDETGDPVKFASGRVLIGLHLKKIV